MKKFLAIVFITIPLVLSGCGENGSSEEEQTTLKPLHSYKIEVPEPSGLDFNADRSGLWCVSDKNGKIYLLDLEGNITRSFDINETDLEAIEALNDNMLAVVNEGSRRILIVNGKGNDIAKYGLQIQGDSDSGLEGLAYDAAGKQMFIANEKSPKVIIRLDSTYKESGRFEIDFADDLSGLFVDEGFLWVLSDESKSITKCNFSCEPLESWQIDAPQPEGIAVDYANRLVYIVSDSQSELRIFRLP